MANGKKGDHPITDIAEQLMVSVRTIDTHVSNIWIKLGVSSRSAATSYAHKRGLA